MIRRTPRPTLFPSTTLFRSQSRDVAPSQSLPGAGANHKGWRTGVYQLPITGGQAIVTRRQAPTVNRLIGRRDRKSTRLNSSHANISYAVFCLKKKNIK